MIIMEEKIVSVSKKASIKTGSGNTVVNDGTNYDFVVFEMYPGVAGVALTVISLTRKKEGDGLLG